MTQYLTLTLFSLSLLGGLVACAPKQAVMPIQSQSDYLVSLKTKPNVIWLQTLVSNQPDSLHGVGEVIVCVRDANGQPVEGVSVTFTLEPPLDQRVKLRPEPVTAQDGHARAILEVHSPGTIKVHVRVDDVTQIATFNFEVQAFGNNTAV